MSRGPGMTEQPGPRGKLKWAGIDLDGTLAEPLWTPDNPTSAIGAPIPENVAKAKALYDSGWKVVIHTSRGWTDYEAIEWWATQHLPFPVRAIHCGKGLFGIMIDDRNVDIAAEDWSAAGNAVADELDRQASLIERWANIDRGNILPTEEDVEVFSGIKLEDFEPSYINRDQYDARLADATLLRVRARQLRGR